MSGKRPSSFKRCLSQPARASRSRSLSWSSVRFLTSPQQSQVLRKLRAQVGARHDSVEVAERQHPLGAAEIVGESFASRAGDDSRPREVQVSAGFGYADIRERCEAGQNAPGAGIRKDGDERDGRLVHEIDGARRLCHLHEAENALLHPSASGAAHAHDRQPVACRQLSASPEAFADDAAHAAAHEAEVDDGEQTLAALDPGSADNHGLRKPCLELGAAQTLGVGLQVDEVEGVDRLDRRPELAERPCVGELPKTLASADANVVLAGRTDRQVGSELRQRAALPTRWAFPLGPGRFACAAFDLDNDVHGRADDRRSATRRNAGRQGSRRDRRTRSCCSRPR